MIVDCHTHISSSADSVELSEHLSAAETVDACIVLAAADDSSEQVNRKLSEYVGKHREKMVGFAFVDPTKDGVGIKGLTSVTEKLGLVGVVLYCGCCGFHPAHSRAMRLYESAQQLGVPVFFHNSGSSDHKAALDYAQPYLLDEVARTFPELKIVIGSMGAPFIEQTLAMVGKHENVYADLAIRPESVWQIYNMVVSTYEYGVMDKLLFGSGFPAAGAGLCIETLLGFNKLLGDTNLPTVPRSSIEGVVKRDTLALLGIRG